MYFTYRVISPHMCKYQCLFVCLFSNIVILEHRISRARSFQIIIYFIYQFLKIFIYYRYYLFIYLYICVNIIVKIFSIAIII